MKILFLHGWQSVPGGVKPTFLAQHGHEVINPALPDDEFEAAVRIAQAEYDRHHPDVIVGSSRGGAVAMNLDAGSTPLVLLCPAWKKFGTAKKIRPNTVILHSRADDVVPFADSEELVRNSGLPATALVEVGSDHRLADPEPLKAMLRACEAEKVSRNALEIPRLPIWGSLILFGIPTLLMWLATRWGIPALRDRLPGPDILCWFVAGGCVFFGLFVAAFAAFWVEQGRVTLVGFADRFRFRRLRVEDVEWSIGLLVGCGLLSVGIAWLWGFAAQSWGALPEPQLSPPFIRMQPVTLETYWVLLAWLPLFVFNIAGEELWWRGYLLPRQKQEHGWAAWCVHGLGLALFHLPLGFDLTIILVPYLFALPYVVQRQKNIWTGFIVHGALNGCGFLAVAFGLA